MAGAGGMKLPSGFTDPEQEARRREQEEQKASILKQILSPEALERLGRVKLVRKDAAEALEVRLIQAAMRGELQKQIGEDELIRLLETAAVAKQQRKVTIKRRNFIDDDDDDDDNDDDLL
mmetsp:Transcript_35207/g.112594  ORF Transcript_35207/g.112594 Transcript_35207/m.112594 type:complete len:120 (-) Transcript_35207:14-373(-)